jgi:hypothetical protein
LIYNLLEERWIPVLWAEGKISRVGIKEALAEAGRIRQVAASNPMDRVAIFRFLLALLYWCKGNPPAKPTPDSRDSFPSEWLSKLDANRDYFNLLSEDKRFYQYRKEGDKPLTVNYLVHEIPAGTNFWHFRHSTDKINGLCPTCCTLGLLRLPLFSTQGGQGKSPGINAKPPIYVIPMGETLAETLWLSWRPVSILGTPAWEKPDLQLPKTGEVPLLTGLTWLPRRVWLGERQESVARCISCGRQDHLFLSAIFAGKGSSRTDEITSGRVWRDPHVIYEQSKKGEFSLHSADAIGAVDAGAGQWARIMGGMLRNLRNEQIRAWVVGFSTDQNKYFEVSELFLPWQGLPDEVEICIEMLNQWRQSRSSLYRKLESSDGRASSSLSHPEIQSMLASIRPHIEDKVSTQAGELLMGGVNAWEHIVGEYRPMMQVVASALIPGFTTAAVRKRKQIANLLPQMGMAPSGTKKPVPEKRGAR